MAHTNGNGNGTNCNCGKCDKHALEKILRLAEEATKGSKIRLATSPAAIEAALEALNGNDIKPH